MGYEILCEYKLLNSVFPVIRKWKVNVVFDTWPEADVFAQALIYRWRCFQEKTDTRKTIFAGEKEIQMPWFKEDGSEDFSFELISAQVIYEILPPIYYA